jgi:hypothetical protein
MDEFGDETLKEAFSMLDAEKKGRISVIGLQSVFKNAKQSDLQEMIASADVGGDGLVDYEEFKLMFQPTPKSQERVSQPSQNQQHQYPQPPSPHETSTTAAVVAGIQLDGVDNPLSPPPLHPSNLNSNHPATSSRGTSPQSSNHQQDQPSGCSSSPVKLVAAETETNTTETAVVATTTTSTILDTRILPPPQPSEAVNHNDVIMQGARKSASNLHSNSMSSLFTKDSEST